MAAFVVQDIELFCLDHGDVECVQDHVEDRRILLHPLRNDVPRIGDVSDRQFIVCCQLSDHL